MKVSKTFGIEFLTFFHIISVEFAQYGNVLNFPVSTAISIKVVHEQSGKVEYERERLLGIANKLINFQSGSQQPFALVFDFSALLVDNLN
jgi:hypothetical protein